MKSRRLRIALLGWLVILSLAVPALAGSPRNFRAHLSQEAPGVETQAQGQAIFQLNKDGTEISYKLIVANIEDVTVAHIHLGGAGASGPPIVFLFGPAAPPVTQNGVLIEGSFTEANLIPRPALGFSGTFAELLDLMASGGVYVNVHTTAYPGGEIRGQIH
ncbi:MAG: CHRD domain-containing protein [Chloroflexota bacterium]|nr:CHRD domain-containing protein [Anaerolineae bacterium]